MSLIEILEYSFNIAGLQLSLWNLIIITGIILFTRLGLWLINRSLIRVMSKKNQADIGRRYALEQFVKYLFYTMGTLFALQSMGVQLSVIWAGSAALLVGLGMGMQQTFNDLTSGLILLIEGGVEVGDMVLVDGIVGKVIQIGLRTSKVETRDNNSIIIPNSKLVTENVLNWSHNNVPTRFEINIGVSYNSDVNLVKKLLLQEAVSQQGILSEPLPNVQLQNFGDSALDFCLYFYSKEYLKIETIKSDLRFKIFNSFRQNKVEIPFPQQDIWLRNINEIAPIAASSVGATSTVASSTTHS